VAHVFVGVARALGGVALLVGTLVGRQQRRLGAVQLVDAEAVLLHALGFLHDRAETFGELALGHHGFDLEQLERAADVARPRLRAQEWRVGPAGNVA
jgi:hypothetical protein